MEKRTVAQTNEKGLLAMNNQEYALWTDGRSAVKREREKYEEIKM